MDAIFVCLNFYATVRRKKKQKKNARRKTAPRNALDRCEALFVTYRCTGKCCKMFRGARVVQRTSGLTWRLSEAVIKRVLAGIMRTNMNET